MLTTSLLLRATCVRHYAGNNNPLAAPTWIVNHTDFVVKVLLCCICAACSCSQAIIIGYSGVKKARRDKEITDTNTLLFGYPLEFVLATAGLELVTALCLVAAPGVGIALLFLLMGGALHSHIVQQGFFIASVFDWVLMGTCLLGDTLEYVRGGPRTGALADLAWRLGTTANAAAFSGDRNDIPHAQEFSARLCVLVAFLVLGFAVYACAAAISTQKRDPRRVAIMSEVNVRQAQ